MYDSLGPVQEGIASRERSKRVDWDCLQSLSFELRLRDPGTRGNFTNSSLRLSNEDENLFIDEVGMMRVSRNVLD